MSPDQTIPFDILLRRAREVIPGLEANRRMFELRSELLEQYGSVVMYEVVLPNREAAAWSTFVARELPKLSEHLIAKKETVPGRPSVAIFVWTDEEAHHFDGPTFWQAIADIEGCEIPQLLAASRGEEAQDSRSTANPPLLLPGPTDTSG
jgi:hypothetical protein